MGGTGPVHALRLTFVRQGDQLRLHSKIPVEVMLPPGDPAAEPGDRGFWLELRDSSDRSIFRRALHDPLPQDSEVFSPDPRQTVSRTPTTHAQSVISVLVPDLPGTETVAVFSSQHVGQPIDPKVPAASFTLKSAGRSADQPAAMIARFTLKG